jgi:hypothetical protein
LEEEVKGLGLQMMLFGSKDMNKALNHHKGPLNGFFVL